MAHDWGHVFRQATGGFVGGLFGGGGATGTYGTAPQFVEPFAEFPSNGAGAATVASQGITCPTECDGMIWAGGVPPAGYKVVNFCGKGVLRKIRRRRRKRLLTASDKADISYIVATTGKGQLAASLIHRSAQ